MFSCLCRRQHPTGHIVVLSGTDLTALVDALKQHMGTERIRLFTPDANQLGAKHANEVQVSTGHAISAARLGYTAILNLGADPLKAGLSTVGRTLQGSNVAVTSVLTHTRWRDLMKFDHPQQTAQRLLDSAMLFTGTRNKPKKNEQPSLEWVSQTEVVRGMQALEHALGGTDDAATVSKILRDFVFRQWQLDHMDTKGVYLRPRGVFDVVVPATKPAAAVKLVLRHSNLAMTPGSVLSTLLTAPPMAIRAAHCQWCAGAAQNHRLPSYPPCGACLTAQTNAARRPGTLRGTNGDMTGQMEIDGQNVNRAETPIYPTTASPPGNRTPDVNFVAAPPSAYYPQAPSSASFVAAPPSTYYPQAPSSASFPTLPASSFANAPLQGASSTSAVYPAQWGYQQASNEPLSDPAVWGTQYRQCSGLSQSPIRIETAEVMASGDFQLSIDEPTDLTAYYALPLKNTGHSVELDMRGLGVFLRSSLVQGAYLLDHIEFHSEAEHLLDSKRYPLEMQLIFKKDDSHLLAIAVLWHEGTADDAFLAPIVRSLPKINMGGTTTTIGDFQFTYLPDEQKYYSYEGSLTSPPCSEGVTWLVQKTPWKASAAQLQSLHNSITVGQQGHDNFRPVQPLKMRTVKLLSENKKGDGIASAENSQAAAKQEDRLAPPDGGLFSLEAFSLDTERSASAFFPPNSDFADVPDPWAKQDAQK